MRDLTQSEEDVIAENEEAENYAVQLLRLEEERLHETFTSVELREWETWAAKAARLGPGAKRARVQVTVQGEGGRIVKQEDWLLGVKEGEYLAYSVSVHQYDDDAEDAPDPLATSSGGAAQGDDERAEEGNGEGVESGDATADHSDDTLPVTGERAPDMWGDTNSSRVRDFSVDDFMETPLAAKFFCGLDDGRSN